MAFGDPMATRRRYAPPVGQITWPEALVRTSAAIVINPLLKDPSQMTLVQGNPSTEFSHRTGNIASRIASGFTVPMQYW